MGELAIRVEDLGKEYRLGGQRERYTTLRDQVSKLAAAPLRALFGREKRSEQDPPFWALKDVSFEVKQGEVVGIIGRNGAGKSTLLKILSRITEPTEGEADIHGRVGSLLEVGTGFHPELTGRENVFLNGAIMGMRRMEIRRRFDEIVAFAEVEKFIDTPVKHYSSGMYMRLAFAVAAHLEPEILIVDEVLAVGDIQFQKKCLGKMGEVAQDGRTVLFVSHNMAAVRNLCTRTFVLANGQLFFDGPIDKGLMAYLDNSAGVTARWQRPPSTVGGVLYFTEVTVAVHGQQPALSLTLDFLLREAGHHPAAFIAIDVRDEGGVPIMQALPNCSGFIQPGRREHSVRVIVELPPLIPGTYTLSPWVGPHNSVTYDWIENVVGFTIEDAPDPSRTFPHGGDHGFIVPISKMEYMSQ